MHFADVPGQNPAKAALVAAVESGRLPHALLLLGPEGCGGLPTGLAFAQYLFCTARTGGDSCGRCPDCTKAAALEHPDLHLSFPALKPGPTKAALSRNHLPEFRQFVRETPFGTTSDWMTHITSEGKRGNISVDEMREIIETLSLKSYEGGRKVLVLWRPEYLGKEGNALLKLIEEPPPDTVLLLVAEATEGILPTILSRLQTVRLAPIPVEELTQLLAEKHGAEPARAAAVAAMAEGSYSAAVSLLNHHDADRFATFRAWMLAVFTGRGVQLATTAEELGKEGREGTRAFLDYAVHLLEHTVRHRAAPALPTALPADETRFVSDLARNTVSTQTLARMAEAMGKTAYLVDRNANIKIQLHALGIRLVRLLQGRTTSNA